MTKCCEFHLSWVNAVDTTSDEYMVWTSDEQEWETKINHWYSASLTLDYKEKDDSNNSIPDM